MIPIECLINRKAPASLTPQGRAEQIGTGPCINEPKGATGEPKNGRGLS